MWTVVLKYILMTKKLLTNQTKQIKLNKLLKHETKRNVLIKFLLIFFVLLVYFIFVSQKYGIQQGFFVTSLTWSFFVLCTPVADAGFLIDFPFRLITRLRMVFSEMFVWIIAISLNLYAFFFASEVYLKTKILTLFQHILGTPFPFWSIILISLIGTFFSIHFGDELLDKIKHKDRKLYKKHKNNYQLVITVFIFVAAIIFYDFFLKKLGIHLLVY